MPVCDEVLAWVTLSRAPALAARTLAAALSLFESAAGILAAGRAALEHAGFPVTAREYLRSRAAVPTPAEVRWLEGSRHEVIPFTDPRYPDLLRAFDDRPLALYASGNVDALRDPLLAVVGSRNPTPQGLDHAFEFSRRLAERGLAIASGLAQGIDTAAHRGALAAQGTTLAVLGAGVDIVYPRGNRPLSEAIEHDGLLVSEFPIGTEPRRSHFPQRNRILASMTLGTLVVEAAPGSGSLITARCARERGREVFAIPGSIQSPLSRGCHRLIKKGAKLAESTDDILNDLNFSGFFERRSGAPARTAAPESGPAGMDKEHKILLDALGFDPADLDTLIVRTGFKAEAVSSMMLILELEGHVQAAPGGRYSRVAYRRAGGER